MSVCNGAFILAKANLLDGLEATTTSGGHLRLLRQVAPKVKVVDDRRFVDAGKIITTAGLSSGIDGALHLVERLYGRATAQMVALGIEYNWDPKSTYVREALADKYMRFAYNVESLTSSWKPLSREGGTDRWENKWLVGSNASASDILAAINGALAEGKMYDGNTLKWVTQERGATNGATQSFWTFTDEKGRAWQGVASVEPVPSEKNSYTLTVRIARGDGSQAKVN